MSTNTPNNVSLHCYCRYPASAYALGQAHSSHSLQETCCPTETFEMRKDLVTLSPAKVRIMLKQFLKTY